MKRINGVPCFRIINKSRDGVIVENPMQPENKRMSWAEFNQTFDVVGNVWCSVKTNTSMARQTKWITDVVSENPLLTISLMKINPSAEDACHAGYNLIQVCEDFRKEFGEKHTDAKVISLLKQCIETLRFTINNRI